MAMQEGLLLFFRLDFQVIVCGSVTEVQHGKYKFLEMPVIRGFSKFTIIAEKNSIRFVWPSIAGKKTGL